MASTPFHDGERHIQALTGEDGIGRRNGRFIRDTLSEGSNRMLETATILNIALSDPQRNVWSFLIVSGGGFVRRIDDATAFIDTTAITAPETLWPLLSAGARIGLVAMDLTSARRFRINGTIGDVEDNGFTVNVAQTCPNCPKYIQLRQPVRGKDYAEVTAGAGTVLDPVGAELIANADTFFVASRSAMGEHDASHRGGLPGFVTIVRNTLVVPDYYGNSMFMTLGNFEQHPQAGLTFVDFDRGAQLNLTGSVSIDLGNPAAHDGTSGRFWTFEIRKWSYVPFRPDPMWQLVAYSRFNPKTG